MATNQHRNDLVSHLGHPSVVDLLSDTHAEQHKAAREMQPLSKKVTRVKSEPGCWTADENEVLRLCVYRHGGKKWKVIAGLLKHKTSMECCQRWRELQNTGTAVKRSWLPSEDQQIVELVDQFGAHKWSVIASHINGRTGKQCRERWRNQLNPAISKAPWTPQEDEVILRSQAQYGNRWAKITKKLPGRTDNSVKNHWYATMNSARKTRPSQCCHRLSFTESANEEAAEQCPSWPDSVSLTDWESFILPLLEPLLSPSYDNELTSEVFAANGLAPRHATEYQWARCESPDELEFALDPVDPSQLTELVDDIFESVCSDEDLLFMTDV